MGGAQWALHHLGFLADSAQSHFIHQRAQEDGCFLCLQRAVDAPVCGMLSLGVSGRTIWGGEEGAEKRKEPSHLTGPALNKRG